MWGLRPRSDNVRGRWTETNGTIAARWHITRAATNPTSPTRFGQREGLLVAHPPQLGGRASPRFGMPPRKKRLFSGVEPAQRGMCPVLQRELCASGQQTHQLASVRLPRALSERGRTGHIPRPPNTPQKKNPASSSETGFAVHCTCAARTFYQRSRRPPPPPPPP